LQIRIYHISFFAALTAVGAFIRVPFLYVPLTLQTFFVLMAGNLLGSRFGAASQFVYLVIGLMGLPIFANGGGPGYILQPTFGYLLAYPLAAVIAGIEPASQSIQQKSPVRHLLLINFLAVVHFQVLQSIWKFLVFMENKKFTFIPFQGKIFLNIYKNKDPFRI